MVAFPQLNEMLQSVHAERWRVGNSRIGRVRQEHPQWDLQTLLVRAFNRRRPPRRPFAEEDAQLLAVQWMKWVVHDRHISICRTRGTVRQSASTRICTV